MSKSVSAPHYPPHPKTLVAPRQRHPNQHHQNWAAGNQNMMWPHEPQPSAPMQVLLAPIYGYGAYPQVPGHQVYQQPAKAMRYQNTQTPQFWTPNFQIGTSPAGAQTNMASMRVQPQIQPVAPQPPAPAITHTFNPYATQYNPPVQQVAPTMVSQPQTYTTPNVNPVQRNANSRPASAWPPMPYSYQQPQPVQVPPKEVAKKREWRRLQIIDPDTNEEVDLNNPGPHTEKTDLKTEHSAVGPRDRKMSLNEFTPPSQPAIKEEDEGSKALKSETEKEFCAKVQAAARSTTSPQPPSELPAAETKPSDTLQSNTTAQISDEVLMPPPAVPSPTNNNIKGRFSCTRCDQRFDTRLGMIIHRRWIHRNGGEVTIDEIMRLVTTSLSDCIELLALEESRLDGRFNCTRWDQRFDTQFGMIKHRHRMHRNGDKVTIDEDSVPETNLSDCIEFLLALKEYRLDDGDQLQSPVDEQSEDPDIGSPNVIVEQPREEDSADGLNTEDEPADGVDEQLEDRDIEPQGDTVEPCGEEADGRKTEDQAGTAEQSHGAGESISSKTIPSASEKRSEGENLRKDEESTHCAPVQQDNQDQEKKIGPKQRHEPEFDESSWLQCFNGGIRFWINFTLLLIFATYEDVIEYVKKKKCKPGRVLKVKRQWLDVLFIIDTNSIGILEKLIQFCQDNVLELKSTGSNRKLYKRVGIRIPYQVLHEMDCNKQSNNHSQPEPDGDSEKPREIPRKRFRNAIALIDKHFGVDSNKFRLQAKSQHSLRIGDSKISDGTDDHIINCCRQAQEEGSIGRVVLITDDKGLTAKTKAQGTGIEVWESGNIHNEQWIRSPGSWIRSVLVRTHVVSK